MPSATPTRAQAECRDCCSFCDRLVHPAGCVAAGCRYLYAYDDERTGARYMGCLAKVYSAEIDMSLLEQAERTRHGFGGVRMTGDPRPQCHLTVERAYHGEGEAFECVNPEFFEPPALDSAGDFDLRRRL